MATTRQEFIDLADELFEEFADFQRDGVFTQILTTDFETGAKNVGIDPAETTQTVKGIEVSYNDKVFDNRLAKAGDRMQIYRRRFFKWLPEIGKGFLTFDSKAYEIVNIKIDPAKATLFLHVRLM